MVVNYPVTLAIFILGNKGDKNEPICEASNF